MAAKSKVLWVKTPNGKDRFPEEGERVLAFVSTGAFIVARRMGGHWVVSWNGATIHDDFLITHWAPLPEEPSGK